MTAFRGPSASARSESLRAGHESILPARRQDDRLRAGEAHLVRERDPVGGVIPTRSPGSKAACARRKRTFFPPQPIMTSSAVKSVP